MRNRKHGDHKPHESMGKRGAGRHANGHAGNGHGMPPRFHRSGLLAEHHRDTQWVYWSIALLGVWLLATVVTFDYFAPAATPPAGRALWLSDLARARAMLSSDVISGLLLVVFGLRALRPNRPLSLWICCAVGVWLNLAPLIFWAPDAFLYLNGTLVGTLVIALTILIPGMPNMVNYMAMGPDQPPGWSYNPSSWAQRSILIALGFAGWLISRYLAAYQLGYLGEAADPFFGAMTAQVLNSGMSRAWPISDAGLGAFAYTLEFLMGWMGASSRWRTMPWMVTLFGILVIPLGLVHIFLVISQPLVVGAWCTFCLLAAFLMLLMIPLEADEVIAMGQFLAASRRKGMPFWSTFFKGGSAEGATADKRTPPIASFPFRGSSMLRASFWGVWPAWPLVLCGMGGLWLMAFPGTIGAQGALAHHAQLCGALIITVSVISMGEALRALRWLNLALALWVAAAVAVLDGGASWVAGAVVPALLAGALSVPRGKVRETYGAWGRFIR